MNAIRINRNELEYEYSWKGDSPDKFNQTVYTDTELLRRNSGYDVLSFINRFMIKYALFYSEEGKKVEKLIHTAPPYIESEEDMTNYIIKNWK